MHIVIARMGRVQNSQTLHGLYTEVDRPCKLTSPLEAIESSIRQAISANIVPSDGNIESSIRQAISANIVPSDGNSVAHCRARLIKQSRQPPPTALCAGTCSLQNLFTRRQHQNLATYGISMWVYVTYVYTHIYLIYIYVHVYTYT